MGCSNSSPSTTLEPGEEPIKSFNPHVVSSDTKIVNFAVSEDRSATKSASRGDNNQTDCSLKKKSEKMKYLKNNKEFIELSIETSCCVNRVLNAIAHNEIMADEELQGLIKKNNQTLQKKQNRYKNLEAREVKVELQIKKEIEKKNTSCNRSNPQYRTNNKTLSASRGHDKQNLKSSRERICPLETQQRGNREQYSRSTNALMESSDYRTKFVQKIDRFRSEVNTIVPKEAILF